MAHDVRVCRKAGSKGGKKTAKRGSLFCEARAQQGGQALVMQYGRDYMRALVMRRYERNSERGRAVAGVVGA